MTDLIIIAVLAVIVAAAGGYVYKAKKSGVKCIGCPAGEGGCHCHGAAAESSGCGCGCGGESTCSCHTDKA